MWYPPSQPKDAIGVTRDAQQYGYSLRLTPVEFCAEVRADFEVISVEYLPDTEIS